MPSPFVAPGYLTLVTSFTIKTSAPAIARPEGSKIRPLIVPLGDCATAAPVRRTRTKRGRGRGSRLTGAAPGSHGFIQIHPVYGSPHLFVSIFFLLALLKGRWSVFRTPRDGWDRCAGRQTGAVSCLAFGFRRWAPQ